MFPLNFRTCSWRRLRWELMLQLPIEPALCTRVVLYRRGPIICACAILCHCRHGTQQLTYIFFITSIQSTIGRNCRGIAALFSTRRWSLRATGFQEQVAPCFNLSTRPFLSVPFQVVLLNKRRSVHWWQGLVQEKKRRAVWRWPGSFFGCLDS
jgi:hypothetical protein